jgi:hypothetical protein
MKIRQRSSNFWHNKFFGPVDGLDVVEKVFMDSEMPLMKDLEMHCFLLVKDMLKSTDF